MDVEEVEEDFLDPDEEEHLALAEMRAAKTRFILERKREIERAFRSQNLKKSSRTMYQSDEIEVKHNVSEESRPHASPLVAGGCRSHVESNTRSDDPMLKPLQKTERDGCKPQDFKLRLEKAFIHVEADHVKLVLNGGMLHETIMDGFRIRITERSKNSGLGNIAMGIYFLSLVRPAETGENYLYRKVARWMKAMEVSMAGLQSILVPGLIKKNHWILVIVDLVHKNIIYYDPISVNSYTLADKITSDIKCWVRDQISTERDIITEYEMGCTEEWSIFYDKNFPKQEDASSCGIYVLFVMEYLSRKKVTATWNPLLLKPSFRQVDIPVLRERCVFHILNGF